MRGSVLVVDDEKSQRDILKVILEAEGYDVECAASGREVLQLCRKSPFDLVLTDLRMPDVDGMALLRELVQENPYNCVIIMTAHGTIDSAVEAMRQGAFDYLTKPLETDELLITVGRAFERIALVRENRHLHQQLKERFSFENLLGQHGKMQEVFRIIAKVARTDSTVLICGESGTGKELVARAIHFNGRRRDKPFSAISCAAIPEPLLESELFGYEKGAFTGAYTRRIGLIESTAGGTLFLDEIVEMSVGMQAKILRVLQERELRRVGGREDVKVDVRIIAATNRDLHHEMQQGRFREDLYYRLNVVAIVLPPLRERLTDIPLLATHFIEKYRRETGKPIEGIAPEALQLLMRYAWPGNVRQLEASIESAIALCDEKVITPEHLPQEVRQALVPAQGLPLFALPPEGLSLRDLERDLVRQALARGGGNISQGARLLGMPRKTFEDRVRAYHLR
ncbi:MAG: sigma-54-dependent Fis family transcriptional regulator [Deltaproteobacteria bacterium]|nr:sigma-54-dependent Fis family transcriptional regulator [Deltaproteobacteria bacterium]